MTDLPLKIRGFSRPELVQYIHAQIKAVVPDLRPSEDFALIDSHLDQALERLAICSRKIIQWAPDEFDPLLSSQHSSFLYLLANTIWKKDASTETATKLFLVNKALHGIELFFKIELPPIFLLVHTGGIVLSNTSYGNYFTIFQNSTVGRFGEDRPTIGAGVVMFPNTSIIGRCAIGDRTVVSQGTNVVNRDSPGHVTIFGAGGRALKFREGSAGILETYYRDVDL